MKSAQRTLSQAELIDILEACEMGRKEVRKLEFFEMNGEASTKEVQDALQRLGTLYSLIPITQLMERIVESQTNVKGAA